MEGKIKGNKAKGRPKRMRFGDIRQWTIQARSQRFYKKVPSKEAPERRGGGAWRGAP